MPYWFDGGHMIWMTLWWLIGIGLFVVLLWVLVGAIRPTQADQSPETILRRRYASGEIDTEEYERRLGALRKTKDAA
jgi:putative membrane protein